MLNVDDVLRRDSLCLSNLSICSMHAPSQTDTTFSHLFLPLAVDRTRRQPSLLPSLPSSFKKKIQITQTQQGRQGLSSSKIWLFCFCSLICPLLVCFPPGGKHNTRHDAQMKTEQLTQKRNRLFTHLSMLCVGTLTVSHSLTLSSLPSSCQAGRDPKSVGSHAYQPSHCLPLLLAYPSLGPSLRLTTHSIDCLREDLAVGGDLLNHHPRPGKHGQAAVVQLLGTLVDEGVGVGSGGQACEEERKGGRRGGCKGK